MGKYMAIGSLSNETLQHIVTLLPQGDRPALMQTCKYLHQVSQPVLWRYVRIFGQPGRNALEAIIDPDKEYGHYTKTLIVTASCQCDVFGTFELFCKAIPRFTNVHDVTLTFSQAQSHILWKLFQLHSIFETTRSEDSTPKLLQHLQPRYFPKLTKLVIHGSPTLIAFGASCSLTTLCSTVYLQKEGFQNLLQTFSYPLGVNDTLQFLSLRLHPHLTNPIKKVLGPLGETFLKLKTLHLFAPGANVVDVLHVFSEEHLAFLDLQELRLNDQCLHLPHSDNVDTLDLILKTSFSLVLQVASHRMNLCSISFGDIHWTKSSEFDTWYASEQHNPYWTDEWSPYDDTAIYCFPLYFDTPPQPFRWTHLKSTHRPHSLALRCANSRLPLNIRTKDDFINSLKTLTPNYQEFLFYHTADQIPPPRISLFAEQDSYDYESDPDGDDTSESEYESEDEFEYQDRP